MAAVKACGARALLSGMAAAWLWDLVRGPAPRPEVTAPGGHRVPGITTKRRLRMSPKDSTKRQGIPVSTVPVTLIAISSVLSFDELARAVHEADVRHDVTGPHIEKALERHPKAKKRSRLLAIATGDAHIVLSRLERHFLTLLRRHRLPLPHTNRPYGAGYVDCRWPVTGSRSNSTPPLSPHPTGLGAGQTARARCPRPRRRVPSLHLARRRRVPRADCGRPRSPTRADLTAICAVKSAQTPDPRDALGAQ